MKVAIWGTGILYQRYKHYLDECDVCFLIDSDAGKQGHTFENRIVYAPEQVDYTQCDYIVILVKKYEEIEQKLFGLGVEERKIIHYFELGKIVSIEPVVKCSGTSVKLGSWMERNKQTKIMLVSHNFSRTGVPIALMNLAILLKKMGYAVIYTSVGTGSLTEELEKNDIDYVSDMMMFLEEQQFKDDLKNFDLFILGTVALAEYISFFSQLNKPVMWWIHETFENMFHNNACMAKKENVHIFAGGKRVQTAIKKYWGMDSKELLYYLPQKAVMEKKKSSARYTFAVMGTYENRKGQDILAKTVQDFFGDYRDKIEVVFVGGAYNAEQRAFSEELKKNYPQFTYMAEMSADELERFFAQVDVLVCPSREDPMPIVVTQAMQKGIPCIISKNVGQAEYIQHGINGFVFESEDSEELAYCMEEIIKNPLKVIEVGKEGERTFNDRFAEKCMKNALEEIFRQLL